MFAYICERVRACVSTCVFMCDIYIYICVCVCARTCLCARMHVRENTNMLGSVDERFSNVHALNLQMILVAMAGFSEGFELYNNKLAQVCVFVSRCRNCLTV